MEVTLPVTKDNKFRGIVEILGCINPFIKLRSRERDVLAELYKLNFRYSHIPSDERNQMIFNKSARKVVAENLGISVDSVYNITMSLRKKGILTEDGFTPKYLVNNVDEIVFKLIER